MQFDWLSLLNEIQRYPGFQAGQSGLWRRGVFAGYERLTVAMAKGGALKAGKHAAAAQTSFDCWMQEAEENFQPKDIAACRNNFYGAMSLLEGAVDKRRMVAKKVTKKKVAKKTAKKKAKKKA